MNNEVNKKYHSNEGFSFGGKHLVYEKYPNISKKEIDTTLSSSDIYTRYKQYSKPRKYSPVFVRNKRELFQCDLVSFTQNNMVQENDGYKHLFTTIDVFSKMSWVYPIRDKKCETVLLCFKDILQKCGKKPQRVQTDRGTEFICKTFENYFKDQMIYHYLSYSDRKCPVIERFNLTIQQLIYKLMESKSSNRWIDCIQQAMEIYLNRKHTTIKMSPLQAEKPENENLVRKHLFNYFSRNSRLKPQKQKFQIGDKVRVWKYHRTFKRGYDKNFTDEYFTIHKVFKNLPVIRYQLKDFKENKIVGNYFQEELVLFTPKDFYKINIIDEKGSGKNKKLLINWDGWPDSYNEWIAASQVENFYQNDDESTNLGNNGNENFPQEELFEEYQSSIADVNNTNDEDEQMNDNETSYDVSENLNPAKDKSKNKPLLVDFIMDKNIALIKDKNENQRRKRNMSDAFKSTKRIGSKKILKVNVVNNMDIEKIIDITKKK